MHQEVYNYLCLVYVDIGWDDIEYLDVRLQVTVNGDDQSASWSVHTGDASYDQDHRGYWGAEIMSSDMDDVAIIDVARSLVDQAIEHCAQCVE